MLSTIKVLSQIEQDFKKSKPLQGYLSSLVTSLQSDKKIVFKNMNGKQTLSQLQSLIETQMKKIDQNLLDLKVDLSQEVQDEVQNSNFQEQQQNDEEQLDGQNREEYQQQGDDDENEMQLQGEEQNDLLENQQQDEDEFAEPQFGNNHQMEQEEEQQQNYDQQEEEQQTKPKKKSTKKKDDYDRFHDQEDQQNQDENQDQDEFDSEQDVGLYGQQLNENDEDFEGYANQFDEEEFNQFQKQFGDKQTKKKDKRKKLKNQEQSENPDEYIEDNFDHFREIELDNQKQQTQNVAPKTDLDNQIDRLEGKVIGKKDWVMKGQIKARQRPANSLLQYDLQFNSGVKYSHQITEERNTELQELIKKRILNDMFDDRTRFVNTNHIREHFGSLKQVSRQKSQMGLGELYESQFKNFLGIGQNKNDKLKTEIMDSFKELNYFLDSLSNFSFVPKPTKDGSKKGQSEAIIVEQKVPLTLWNGQKQVQKDGKMRFESEKQVDNQGKRLKNKRIARQRKKQQMKKKLNKVIEYGGITKFEAQAKKKAQMNNKPLKIDGVNMKYNKSSSFFKNMNEQKGGKPNPDISKMKI